MHFHMIAFYQLGAVELMWGWLKVVLNVLAINVAATYLERHQPVCEARAKSPKADQPVKPVPSFICKAPPFAVGIKQVIDSAV